VKGGSAGRYRPQVPEDSSPAGEEVERRKALPLPEGGVSSRLGKRPRSLRTGEGDNRCRDMMEGRQERSSRPRPLLSAAPSPPCSLSVREGDTARRLRSALGLEVDWQPRDWPGRAGTSGGCEGEREGCRTQCREE